VALVGGSGAGKTTLLKTINALIAPTTGRVLIDGADVVGQPGPACGGGSATSSRRSASSRT
jgi:osmoprotectant transport system ATP-binding protein